MTKTKINNNNTTVGDDMIIVIETMKIEKSFFILYFATLSLEHCDRAENLMYGGLKVDSTACSCSDLEQVIDFSCLEGEMA